MTSEEALKVFDELKSQGYSEEDIVGTCYLMFQNDKLDLEELQNLIGLLGYELSPEFLAMSPEDQKTKGWEETGEDEDGERAEKGDDEAPDAPAETEEAKEYDEENPAPVFGGNDNDDEDSESAAKKSEGGEGNEDKKAEDEEDDEEARAAKLFGYDKKKN